MQSSLKTNKTLRANSSGLVPLPGYGGMSQSYSLNNTPGLSVQPTYKYGSTNWNSVRNIVTSVAVHAINSYIDNINFLADTAVNLTNFAVGFAYEYLDNVSFGMVSRITPIDIKQQSSWFKLGATTGRIASIVQGGVEFISGANILATDAVATGTTTGLTPVTGGASNLALAVEIPVAVVGTALAVHGASIELLAFQKNSNDNLLGNTGNNLVDGISNYGDGARDIGHVSGADSIGPDNFDNPNRNPNQDKELSKGEIDILKKNGIDPHDYKPNSKYDIFKDVDGNLYVKPKGGIGYGEPINININDLK